MLKTQTCWVRPTKLQPGDGLTTKESLMEETIERLSSGDDLQETGNEDHRVTPFRIVDGEYLKTRFGCARTRMCNLGNSGFV
jgi:hypothetical protein